MTERTRQTGWAGLSLAAQFALAGGVVILAAALIVGSLVAGRIEEVVVRNTANSTALYMESFVSPLIQDLHQHESLSSRTRKDIAGLLEQTELGRRVVSFKVWRQNGLVLDASNKALVGQVFEPTENLRLAWKGEVRADFQDTNDAEDRAEDALDVPLLEIYSPIRNQATGEVIAVVEFYEIAETLRDDIIWARMLSWTWVGGILALIGGALFLIVLRGSRTIDAQILALREMSVRNLSLRLQIQEASARAATMGERALRQIGADLHDGPAQLMAFAALRLDVLKAQVQGDKARADLAEVAGAISEAIGEIRNLSRGLSVPDLDRRDMSEVLAGLADAHAARTGTAVRLTGIDAGLPDLPAALRLCVYRFVQEGLNNAWRHAKGRGQELRLVVQNGRMQLSVLDDGPGFPPGGPTLAPQGGQRLGLMGLKDRVEALGGHLEFLTGTRSAKPERSGIGPEGGPEGEATTGPQTGPQAGPQTGPQTGPGAELRMTIEIRG